MAWLNRNNCHHFVAEALNHLNYQNSRNWTVTKLALTLMLHGKNVSTSRALRQWLPFAILVFVVVLCVLIFA